jgi:predicted PurR-regulated permease PerM
MEKPDDYVNRSFEVFIRLGLMLGIAIWCFQIMRPFISPVIWGMIIAVALNPLYMWLLPKFGGRRGLCASLLTIVALGAVITPSVQLSGAMLESAKVLAVDVKDGSLDIPAPPEGVKDWPLIGDKAYEVWSLSNENLGAVLGTYETQLKTAGAWML